MRYLTPFFYFLISFFLTAWGLRALTEYLHEGREWHVVWAYSVSIALFLAFCAALFQDVVASARDPELTDEQRRAVAPIVLSLTGGTILGWIFLQDAVELIVMLWSSTVS